MMDNVEHRQIMLDVIGSAIQSHPRSLQKEIGPSQIGCRCQRKLGFRLAQIPAARIQAPGWRPTVGTAVHVYLSRVFNEDNYNYPPTKPRWITDTRVSVGYIDGAEITGSLDLYDAYLHRLVDFKIPGPTSIKDKKRHGPGREYKIQVALYARGLEKLIGEQVHNVGILFLPSNGELSESYYWSEPYDEQIAIDALTNAESIAVAMRLLGPEEIIPLLPTAPDNCGYCDWFIPGNTFDSLSCNGDDAMTVRKPDQFTDLLVPTRGVPHEDLLSGTL